MVVTMNTANTTFRMPACDPSGLKKLNPINNPDMIPRSSLAST
jgi:hypothetical protein